MKDNIQRVVPFEQVTFGNIGIGVVFLMLSGKAYMKIGHLDAVALTGPHGVGHILNVNHNQPITLVKDPVISGTEIL